MADTPRGSAARRRRWTLLRVSELRARLASAYWAGISDARSGYAFSTGYWIDRSHPAVADLACPFSFNPNDTGPDDPCILFADHQGPHLQGAFGPDGRYRRPASREARNV